MDLATVTILTLLVILVSLAIAFGWEQYRFRGHRERHTH